MEENKLSREYWLNQNGKVLSLNDQYANEFVMTIDPQTRNPILKFEVSETLFFQVKDSVNRNLAKYIVLNLKPITESQAVDVYRLIVRFIDGFEPDIYLGFIYYPNVILSREDIINGCIPDWSWFIEDGKFASMIAINQINDEQCEIEEVYQKNADLEFHGTGMRYIAKSTLEQISTTLAEYLFQTSQVVRGIPPFDWQNVEPVNNRFFALEFCAGDHENSLIELIQARQIHGLHNVWLDVF